MLVRAALRPALLPFLMLLLAGALLLATPGRAQGAGGGEESGAPSESPEEGGGDVTGDDNGGGDEDDAGGGSDADAALKAQAPPRTEATTIRLDAAALETEGETSSKETVEPSTEPATTGADATTTVARLPLYRVTDRGGQTCILMEMDAVVGVFYETKSKEMRDMEEYVGEVKPTGTCGDDEAQLTIEWKSFLLRWSFSKTPGGERWYVNLVELQYDKSDSLFENASSVGEVTLSTRRAHGTMLFPTPVGKSYHCQSEYKLQLSPSNGRGSDTATLFLREFRMQPFMYKPIFGTAFECTPGGVTKYRDETAPIAVGSTLAVVVLLTVTGYGVYRYFKIKKVQYDTME